MDSAPPLGPEPTNSSLRQKRAAAVSTRKLAPLDHIRTLYSGARQIASHHGGQRKVFEKQELVGAVRRMSPLRNPTRQLTQQIFKESEAFTESRTEGKLNTGDTELRLLQDNLNNSTRRYNTLKSQADREQYQLATLLDKMGQLEYEVNALKELEDNATPDAQRLKKLKHRWETVARQIESKVRYQHQLDHMVETLEENHIKVDAHIKTMNDALSASRREFESVKTLMRQLYSARDKAFKDLQEVQNRVVGDERRRKQILEQRRREAYAAERMEEWRKQQEAMRLELAAELCGEMSKEEEERLMARLVQKQKQSEQLQQETAVKTREALTLQEAFLKIRQATGVATLEEMVDKFLGQDANKHSLEHERAHVEQQLAKAKGEKEKMESQFADLKASGVGGTELTRDMYDKLDRKIARAKASLRVNKASAERLESVLVAVRQGALGLSQRLSPYGHLISSQERLELPHTGIEALDLLLYCEALLRKLVQAIRRKQQEAKKQRQVAMAGRSASPPPGRRSRGGSRPSTPVSGRQSPASARSGASVLMTPTLEVPEDTEVAEVNVRVPSQRVGQDAGQWVDVGVASDPGEAGEKEEEEKEEEELNEAARREMKVQARRKVQQEETRAEAQRKAAEAEKEGKSPSKPSAKARKAQQLQYMSKLSSSVSFPVSHPVPAPTSPDIQPKSATFLTQ